MILKHRDCEVLRFEWRDPFGVRIVSVSPSAKRFLPLEMKGEATDEALWAWLRHRTIPRNRRNVEVLLSELGLDAKDVRGIIGICRGLSLNDVHWVVEEDFKGTWAECNLYDNRFSETVARLAFNGSGSHPESREWTSSPELTTNGVLAKCWRRVGGEVVLYKSGSEGAANAGFEPYSEFYAAQLAKAMGLPHVEYGLAKFKGRLCSTCSLFTSEKYGYLPAGRLISKATALLDPRFANIFLFDALILNTDRHLGNFGYLVDNDTNRIVGPAPIFDNGYGLFSRALDRKGNADDEFDDLLKFATRIEPSLYRTWLGFPGGITGDMLKCLKRLRGFRFTRHHNYNLSSRRLSAIEDFLQKRIYEIVKYGEKADEFINLSKYRVGIKTKNIPTSGVLNAIKENIKADPYITVVELAELLQVTMRTIERRLGELRATGEVRRIGARKNGYWEVVEG